MELPATQITTSPLENGLPSSSQDYSVAPVSFLALSSDGFTVPSGASAGELTPATRRRIESNKLRAQERRSQLKRARTTEAPNNECSQPRKSAAVEEGGLSHSRISPESSATSVYMDPDPLQVARALTSPSTARFPFSISSPSAREPVHGSMYDNEAGMALFPVVPLTASFNGEEICNYSASTQIYDGDDFCEEIQPPALVHEVVDLTSSPPESTLTELGSIPTMALPPSTLITGLGYDFPAVLDNSSHLNPQTGSTMPTNSLRVVPGATTTDREASRVTTSLRDDECPICLYTLAYAHNMKCGCTACYTCLNRYVGQTSGVQKPCPCCRRMFALTDCNYIRKFDQLIESSLTGQEKDDWERRQREGKSLKAADERKYQPVVPGSVPFQPFTVAGVDPAGSRMDRMQWLAEYIAALPRSHAAGFGHFCIRCGRSSHDVSACYAVYNVDGHLIDQGRQGEWGW
jgi:hypothetical protein